MKGNKGMARRGQSLATTTDSGPADRDGSTPTINSDFSTFEYLLGKYGPVMTTAQVAKLLQHHETHVRDLCSRGELPAFKIGKRWHIRTIEIAAIIEGAA